MTVNEIEKEIGNLKNTLNQTQERMEQLGVLLNNVKSQEDKNSIFDKKHIPSATLEAIFHGEHWYKCPHCNNAVEAYSWENTDRREVKICPRCGGKTVVGYYGVYYED